MNPKFQKLVNEVERLHGELMGMTPVTRENLGACNYPGVYLFTERGNDLYVGRTKRPLKTRLMEHARSSVMAAPFAFRLAREATGNLKASYKSGDKSRDGLMRNPKFAAAFREQSERIGKMSIRYVRVDDATTQALLEIYTATVLGTPQNEFKTT